MTYVEKLEGERLVRWVCPECGCASGSVSVDDSGWDEDMENYVEYAVFNCGDGCPPRRIRIVYSEKEWIEGWGDKPEEE